MSPTRRNEFFFLLGTAGGWGTLGQFMNCACLYRRTTPALFSFRKLGNLRRRWKGSDIDWVSDIVLLLDPVTKEEELLCIGMTLLMSFYSPVQNVILMF
jgi:hypothetical protein